ncbi:hypothetical protein MNBD_GAMMA25-108 [hydrothermal vent metagenome]|uniref:Uncharacterized protein n=1 Tax=hydrothermal vent metagenome TaxID=652676 RepID=A0A3B1B4I0_9ZZZZ
MNKTKQLKVAAPWIAGAGLALGHIAITTNCTLTTQGRCSTCGSCVIAIVSLVSWAIFRNRQKDSNHINCQ